MLTVSHHVRVPSSMTLEAIIVLLAASGAASARPPAEPAANAESRMRVVIPAETQAPINNP